MHLNGKLDENVPESKLRLLEAMESRGVSCGRSKEKGRGEVMNGAAEGRGGEWDIKLLPFGGELLLLVRRHESGRELEGTQAEEILVNSC